MYYYYHSVDDEHLNLSSVELHLPPQHPTSRSIDMSLERSVKLAHRVRQSTRLDGIRGRIYVIIIHGTLELNVANVTNDKPIFVTGTSHVHCHRYAFEECEVIEVSSVTFERKPRYGNGEVPSPGESLSCATLSTHRVLWSVGRSVGSSSQDRSNGRE